MGFYIKKYNPSWGSHIPVLIKVFQISQGPVLELGMGLFSTPLLHDLCVEAKRKLVSFENHLEFFNMFQSFINDVHQINLTDDWDKIEIENTHWGMVLVDHEPEKRRIVDIERITHNADYIIIHDSEPRFTSHYRYDLIYPMFKYHFDFILRHNYAHTTVLSNLKDLSELKKTK